MNIFILTIALLIVSITMMANIRDMRGCDNFKQCLHLIACVMCATLPILWLPYMYYSAADPSPMLTGIVSCWAIKHVTTHHQKPWHKWIWRGQE